MTLDREVSELWDPKDRKRKKLEIESLFSPTLFFCLLPNFSSVNDQHEKQEEEEKENIIIVPLFFGRAQPASQLIITRPNISQIRTLKICRPRFLNIMNSRQPTDFQAQKL